MKIQFIANACQIIEKDGYRLLTDPWIDGPCFDGGWYHAHPLKYTVDDVKSCDVVYISHIHEDHLHPPTLKHFPKSTQFFTLKNNFVARKLKGMGFENVQEMTDKELSQFGPFWVTMYEPFQGNRYHDTELGNLIDSAILIDDGQHKLLNTNDNFPTKQALQEIQWDAVQINYNNAGPYPDCFPHETANIEVLRDKNIQNIVDVTDNKKALVIPFAGEFVYQDGTTRSNLTPTQAYDRLTAKGQNAALLNPYMAYDMGDLLKGDAYTKTYQSLLKKASKRLEAKIIQYKYPHGVTLHFKWHDVWGKKHYWTTMIPTPSQTYSSQAKMKDFHYTFKKNEEYLYDILTHKTNMNNAEIGQHVEIIREPKEYDPDFHMLIAFFHA